MNDLLMRVKRQLAEIEDSFDSGDNKLLERTVEVIAVLRQGLQDMKSKVVAKGFPAEEQEIEFFKRTKPLLLGKLIYYNNIFKIESASPLQGGSLRHAYLAKHLQLLRKKHQASLKEDEFYRYYRSGRTDLDTVYYKRGNMDFKKGMADFIFEFDASFSTYYDYKIAGFVAGDLLYTYLSLQVDAMKDGGSNLQVVSRDVVWTASASALIELIYAFHACSSFSNGTLGIRDLSRFLQNAFGLRLNDVHHAFHRMKTRAGSRTLFLDQLKSALEEYMDKDL